jgi:hypothetical protein
MADRWLAALTEREIQILRLVADGRTNTAIAHAWESAHGPLPSTSSTPTANSESAIVRQPSPA